MLNIGSNTLAPGMLLQMQRTQVKDQLQHPDDMQYDPNQRDFEERQQQYKEEMDKERGANLLTELLMGRAGGMAGRGIPAYNKNEAQGRQGLVDPSLTGQETMLPNPIDRQLEQASNLRAVVESLPPQLRGANDQIVHTIEATIPQMQRALRQQSTIYENAPSGFMQNRINLALMRKRQSSLYAVV